MSIHGLNQTAAVYTPGANGDFTVLAKSGLRVRLAYKPTAATGAAERDELDERRLLLWDEDYTMPASAQVLVGGQRWNVRPGTVGALRGLDEKIIYRRAEVTAVLGQLA
jgi:hypothetical protein